MTRQVGVFAADQDFIIVNGNTFASIVDTACRLNGYFENENTPSNLDESKYTRFFAKGGTYKIRMIYFTFTDSGKIDIGLDSNGANNIFSQVDFYSVSALRNVVKETTLEISRGYHDIHFKANGKNASSSGYTLRITALEFDLIQEYPVYQDQQLSLQNSNLGKQNPALQSATLAADYTTTTTTNDVSTGTGITIKSQTNRIKIDAAAIISNSLINDGVVLKIYRSTSAIPAQGSANGGSDTAVYTTTVTEVVAAEQVGIPIKFVDTGLTPGVTYYYYITIKAVTAGTAKIQGGNNQTTILGEPV